MKTIVAATDFSQPSLNAVYYAAEMADYLKKNLVILHVCELPLVATEVPYPGYDLAMLRDVAESDIKNLEQKLKQQRAGTTEITSVVRTGEVIAQINDYCSSLPVYAVVMGINGAGGKAGHLLFGSRTLEALKELDSPLIIVPEDAVFMTIERIGIASDFMNVSKKIHFTDIRNFVRDLHADLHVLHIKQKKATDSNGKLPDEFRVFRELMSEFNPAYHIVERKHVEDAINDLVKILQIDLLIVMPGKHKGLEKLFHKSHSRELTLSAHVPILAIHE